MAGNDIRKMSDEIHDILTNKEVIAIDQDPLGKQGYQYFTGQGNLGKRIIERMPGRLFSKQHR